MTDKQQGSNFFEQAVLCMSALFYVLFGWLQWWSGVSPRLIRGSAEREAIHHTHLNLGATLFVILILCLLFWLLKPGSTVVSKLKGAFANASSSAISLFFVAIFFAMLFGFGQAWSKDETTAILGVFPMPQFLDWDWGTSGYMHAAVSSITTALFLGIVFVFLFTHLKKYVKPGLAVAILLLVHVLVNLPKPPSMHPIAAFGTYVMVPTYYLTALALYTWANNKKLVYWPVFGFFILFFLYLPYFAFKVLPPWHVKPAAKITLVEPKEALGSIRTKADIFPEEARLIEAQAVTSWCMQCHKTVESDVHLLGPNLAGVFNRQAGTVQGYGRYSSAMVQVGLDGVFWTPENLEKFLTDGKNFVPGNLMNQQTDFSDPEKLQLAIDYLEYISAE